MIKVVARAQSAKESGLREGVMLFARVEEVNSKKLLLFEHLSESESGNQIITLPFDTYERVAASIGSKPAPESKSGPWLRVGQDYALALVTGR